MHRWSVSLVALLAMVATSVAFDGTASGRGRPKPQSNAFTASASFTVNPPCLGDPGSNPLFEDVVEYMLDQGYSVSTGFWEYPELSLAGDVLDDFRPFDTPDSTFNRVIFDESGGSSVRMGPHDIVFTILCTPSANNAFSIRGYNYRRVSETGETASRSSLGDSLNAATIKTLGPRDDPYNAPILLSASADPQAVYDLKTALALAGPRTLAGRLNVDVIPTDGSFTFSNSDLDVPRDRFALWMRQVFAGPTQEAFSAEAEVRIPATLNTRGNRPVYIFSKEDPAPVPVRPTVLRETYSPVHRNLDKFEGRFDSIVGDVIRHFENQGFDYVSDSKLDRTTGATVGGHYAGKFDHGFACIDADVDCGLDDREDLYVWDQQARTLAPGDFYVAVGVNYARLEGSAPKKMAVYNSIGLFKVEDESAPENVFAKIDRASANGPRLAETPVGDFVDIRGRSARALAHDVFLIGFARTGHCPGATAPICVELGDDELASDAPFVLAGQLTHNPATATMPDADQYRELPWRLLHFTVPAP